MHSFKYVGPKIKLFDAIQKNSIELSFNHFNKLLRKKDIKVNGKRTDSNIEINSGDEIILYINNKDLAKQEFVPDIKYEDENILIINKPAGLETCGDNSLEKLLSKLFINVYACHRLDRNTSGLIIFAKNFESQDEIAAGLNNGQIEKYYFCKAYGVFEKKREELCAYLFKDSKKAFVIVKDKPEKGYIKIETHYRVLKQFDNFAELEVRLVTGKTHQIRAHLAHLGHPLLGDGKYGQENINKEFKLNKQCLISYKLVFKFKKESFLNYLNEKEIILKF